MLRRPIPIEQMVQEFKKNHANSHLFKIDNFSLLIKYDIDYLESSAFDLCGRKWKIVLNIEHEKNVSVFLENQDPVEDELEFQVYVVSQLKAEWYPKNTGLFLFCLSMHLFIYIRFDCNRYIRLLMRAVRWDFGASPEPIEKGITNLMSLSGLKSKGFLIGDCCMFGATLPDQDTERPGTAECFSFIEKPPNNKVTWMMTKFSSFDPDEDHRSNPFVVGNRTWRIEVHPTGCAEVDGESFSVYLVGEGFINNAPKTRTYANFKLRVLDQVNRNHVEKTPDTKWYEEEFDDSIGFPEFMPLSKLDEPYLVKDKLYVGVEFKVISVTKYV